MTLWNIIRDFFVQYVFGGTSTDGSRYDCLIGKSVVVLSNGEVDDIYNASATELVFNIGTDYNGLVGSGSANTAYISMSDWLSTTATIITLIIICVLIGFFVRWLFRLTSGLIQGRG